MFISPEGCVYQCIFWRPNPLEPPQTHMLNTVKYGLITSPYQAIRTLHQLANDISTNHPAASKTILNDFYVDEMITSRETFDGLSSIQKELIHVLSQSGFELRKWASNCPPFLDIIHLEHRITNLPLSDQLDATVNVLGISWNAIKHTFSNQVGPAETTERVTK